MIRRSAIQCVKSNKFKELLNKINDIEEALQYPNCEGHLDEKRILEHLGKWLHDNGYIKEGE